MSLGDKWIWKISDWGFLFIVYSRHDRYDGASYLAPDLRRLGSSILSRLPEPSQHAPERVVEDCGLGGGKVFRKSV